MKNIAQHDQKKAEEEDNFLLYEINQIKNWFKKRWKNQADEKQTSTWNIANAIERSGYAANASQMVNSRNSWSKIISILTFKKVCEPFSYTFIQSWSN